MLVKTRSNLYERSHECFSEIISELGAKKGSNHKLLKLVTKHENEVIKEAERLKIPNNRTPFIPVFPLGQLSIEEQLNFIEDPRGDHFSEIKDREVCNKIKNIPDSSCYFIFGVEDGRETENKKLYSTKRDMAMMGMSPLTLAEMLSVAIFTESLEERNLWALKSCHKDGRLPLLETNGSGPVKKLIWSPSVTNFEGSGVPSCMARRSFE